jgi:hypothetical protein
MQPDDIFAHDALCVPHHAAADVISRLRTMDPRMRRALAVLLLSVVDAQDDPDDHGKLEIVRDAVCRVLEAIEPGLIEMVPSPDA